MTSPQNMFALFAAKIPVRAKLAITTMYGPVGENSLVLSVGDLISLLKAAMITMYGGADKNALVPSVAGPISNRKMLTIIICGPVSES
ncbi:MAG: hypothetical protein ACE5OZ_04050 [Candidatus Heimdallarchaeota archaeon]